jgi:hypothetical protein
MRYDSLVMTQEGTNVTLIFDIHHNSTIKITIFFLHALLFVTLLCCTLLRFTGECYINPATNFFFITLKLTTEF